MNRIVLLATVTALSGACSDAPEEQSGPAMPAGDLIVFTAGTSVTRTELGAGDRVLWTTGDRIGIYSDLARQPDGSEVSNTALKLLAGEGTSEGFFGGSIVWSSGTHRFYAYYPYSESAGASPAAVGGTLPAVQSQPQASVPGTGQYDFMWARAVADPSTSAAPVALAFSHPFSVIEFRVATSDPALTGRSLKSIVLSAPAGNVLAGYFTFDLTADTPQPTFGGNNSAAVRLNLGADAVLSAADTLKAWMVVAPADLTGSVVDISLEMSDTTVTLGKQGRIFEAQHIYSVAVNPGSVIGLNADGVYSNCYIVPPRGNTYTFDGRVQGNGSSAGGFVPQTMRPASARRIWQTGAAGAPDVVSDVGLSADGQVRFVAGNVPGSAVIGTFDASGALLWSWHIWNCDYSASAMDELYINRAGERFTMMGRNLGASDNTPNSPGAYGMLYQWGRKDPFIGAANLEENVGMDAFVNDNTAPTRHDPAYEWAVASSSADAGTLEYAVSHPTVFIASRTERIDWLETPVDGLWGSGTVKTLYDPCPKGYRVPFENAWTRFTFTGDQAFTYDQFNVSNFSTATAEEGLKFYIQADRSGPVSYYPYTKYRTGVGSLYNAFPVTYMWADSAAQLYADCFDYEHTTIIDPKAYTGRAYGFNVRCMKE